MEPNHTSVCVRRADTTLRAADGDQAGGWYRGSRLSTEYDSLSLKPCEFNFSQKKKKSKWKHKSTNLDIVSFAKKTEPSVQDSHLLHSFRCQTLHFLLEN